MNSQGRTEEITLNELFKKIKNIVRYFLSKKIIIIISATIGGIAGFIYALNDKPTYTATLTFTLEEQSMGGGFGGAMGLASQLGFDIGGDGSIFSGDNLLQLFKSRSIVEKTLLQPYTENGKTFSFAQKYTEIYQWKILPQNSIDPKQVFPKGLSRATYSRSQDSILGLIYTAIITNNLKVDQIDKKVDIMTIEVTSLNEGFAKYFTEALAKEVSDFYIATKTKKAQGNMNILQRQTDSVRSELNQAITGIATETDNTFGLNPALSVKRVPSSKKGVDMQANNAMLMELVKQSELAKIMLRKETPLIQVIDRPMFPLKKEKLGKIKSAVLGGFLGTGFIFMILLFMVAIKRINSL